MADLLPGASTDSPAPAPATATPTATSIPSTISIRAPRRFNLPSSSSFITPPLEWLARTWTVTHSTLPMWNKAKNVRITYKVLENGCLDDEVSSTPTQKTLMPQPKSIKGIDSPDGVGAWKWRGSGLLRFVTSKWEVLGWGEVGGELWAVTYFESSLFTPAGVDIYSARKEGISEGLYENIMGGLKGCGVKDVEEMCGNDMFKVVVDDA